MRLSERVPLSTLTTLRVGGEARFVAECETVQGVLDALLLAKKENLPWKVLGEGSNVLAPDAGYPGVVLLMRIPGIREYTDDAGTYMEVGAGVGWDAFVRKAAERGLWGVENLAGIPGTVGAAPVQNIGAYGMEVKDSIAEVRVLDTMTMREQVLTNAECAFGYRESMLKRTPTLIILSVLFKLNKTGVPKLEYKDLAQAEKQDVLTPQAIGDLVRSIRARKFPDLTECGTAGSFFKNPVVTNDAFTKLQELHTELPGYPNEGGIKVPLGFILDRILNLRGYREGNVRLYEHQALVLVADGAATSTEVNVFAESIASLVEKKTGLKVEREVQNFV